MTGLVQGLLGLLLGNVLVLVAGLVVLAAFVHLERMRRSALVLTLVLVPLVLDVALYPAYGTSNGVFQPVVAGRSVGLTPLLAVVALVARLLVHRRDGVLRAPGALWGLLLLWTAASGYRGVAADASVAEVQNQLLLVPHLAVLGALAATTPVDQLVGRWGVPLLAGVTAPVALVNILLDAAGVELSLDLRLFEVYAAGGMGADAATVYASIGAVAAALALTAPPGRRRGLLGVSVLLAAPLFGSQRAAWLGLAAVVAVLAAGVVLQGRSRAFRLYGGEVVAAVLVLSTVGSGVVLLSTLSDGPGLEQAVTEQVDRTFASTAKQQSAESRRNQWGTAADLIGQSPVVGHGLGVTFTYFEVGPDELRRSAITHNTVLDVAVRTGLVGVVLLLSAAAATTADGVRTAASRGAVPARAVALGALALLAGLAAKGMVESVFEKHRLALLIGVGIGLVAAAARDAGADGEAARRQRDGELRRPAVSASDRADGDLVGALAGPGPVRSGTVEGRTPAREEDRWN